ncbi:4179_t:CDS:2, partial [Acaulospora morrowiae]
ILIKLNFLAETIEFVKGHDLLSVMYLDEAAEIESRVCTRDRIAQCNFDVGYSLNLVGGFFNRKHPLNRLQILLSCVRNCGKLEVSILIDYVFNMIQTLSVHSMT